MSYALSVGGPALCGVVYFITGAAFAVQRRPGWALCYFAYGLANVGLVWASIQERSP